MLSHLYNVSLPHYHLHLLHSAVKTCQDTLAAGEEGESLGAEGFSFSARPSDLAALRSMASEITDMGARMYDLLKVSDG